MNPLACVRNYDSADLFRLKIKELNLDAQLLLPRFRMKNSKNAIFVPLIFLVSFSHSMAKPPREQLLAAYIFQIIEHIHWPSNKDQYKLYVYEDGSKVFDYLVDAARYIKKNKKKVVIYKVNKGEIPYSADIIFVSKKSNLNHLNLYRKTALSPILLISDSINDDRYALIDFQNTVNNKLTFKINKSNIINRNLKVDPKIIFLGGTEIDVAHLYKESEVDRHKQIKHLENLKKEFTSHKKSSDKVMDNWKQAESKVISRNETIKNQAQKIDSQQLVVDQLITQTEKQTLAIKENSKILEQRELALVSLQTQINNSLSILSEHKLNIDKQKDRIDVQASLLNTQSQLISSHKFTIKTQKHSIFLIAFSLFISFLLMLMSFYAYRHKKSMNVRLMEYTKHLAKAKQDAEISAQTKSAFLSCMSHELRSPLTSIIGFSEMMKSEPSFSVTIKKNIAVINSSGEHLLALINDILDLSKLESGQIEFYNEILSLTNLCDDIVNMFQVSANNKHLDLRLNLNPSCHQLIYTDATKLRRLLINLVSNAIKYTTKGSVTIDVQCVSSEKPSQVELQVKVKDTGIGILPADQDSIFTPFEQVNSDQNANWQTGTGLGLSICKQLVELMDGNIQLDSTSGKGSVFSFSILVGIVQDQEMAIPNVNSAEIIGFESANSINILIVEDLEESAMYLSQVLQKTGCNINIAENGQQAIQAYLKFKPDLIFMDKRMPEVDGIAAAQSIRQLEGGGNVIIIAITASAFDDIKKNINDGTFNDYIQKPYSSKEIYSCLRKHLNLKFVYAKPAEKSLSSSSNTLKEISNLTEQTKIDLRLAVTELNIDKTLSAIENVKKENEALSIYLTTLIDDFDFSSFKSLLNADDIAQK